MLEDKIGIQQFCNLKQPYRPVKKNYRSVIAFLLLFISSNYSLGNFLCKKGHIYGYCSYNDIDHQGRIYIALHSLFCIAAFVSFLLVMFSDPGFLTKKVNIKVFGIEILVNSQRFKLCMPRRSALIAR
jgi:hypothetical protein